MEDQIHGGLALLDPRHPPPIAPPPVWAEFEPVNATGTGNIGAQSAHAAVLLAAAGVVLIAALLEIHHDVAVRLFGYTMPETCTWRRVYGIDCMGCGLTRSFISMAHFQPLRAWNFNPAGPILFAGVLFQLPYRVGQLYRLRRSRPTWSAPVYLYLGWIFLSVGTLLTQWIVRTAWPMWISP